MKEHFRSIRHSSFEEGLEAFIRGGREMRMTHDQPRASIPAENRFIVSRRTERLGFFIPAHRFAQPIMSVMPGPRHVTAELCLRPPFADDPHIVSPFVLPAKPRH